MNKQNLLEWIVVAIIGLLLLLAHFLFIFRMWQGGIAYLIFVIIVGKLIYSDWKSRRRNKK